MAPTVLHLSTYAGGGGAARAASNVNKALQRAGINSRMLTAHGNRFKLARAADRALWSLQRSPVNTWRSPALFGSLSAKEINASSADVVNVHWVTDGYLSIRELGKIHKPIVMSMYDMWPFCGTEHYAADTPDARWRVGYSRGNRLPGESGLDIDLHSWLEKEALWSDFHMIPASSWLETATRESALCMNWPITRIPHAVDETSFRPLEKERVRAHLGLDTGRPTVGFVASAGIRDSRKGFDLLEGALCGVIEQFPNTQLLVVGPEPPKQELPAGLPLSFLGATNNDEQLAQAYSAMDVLVVPSRQDNLPLTAIEAQMCGRPVVGFRTGGLCDIVDPGISGYLAQPFDTVDLSKGVIDALERHHPQPCSDEETRSRAASLWSFKAIASQYERVYSLG